MAGAGWTQNPEVVRVASHRIMFTDASTPVITSPPPPLSSKTNIIVITCKEKGGEFQKQNLLEANESTNII